MEQERNKKFVNDVDEMTTLILMHLDTMITDEECDFYIEVTEENITEFFTALNNAVCHKLIKIGMAESLLKAQYVFNNLLVQYLVEVREQKINSKLED